MTQKKEHSIYYVRDEAHMLPQHHTYYEKDFQDAILQIGNLEKQIKIEEDTRLGVWCENMQYNHRHGYFFSPVIRLHPEKDLLVTSHPQGKICKWSYQPHLQFAGGVQTNQWFIHDLTLLPETDGIAIVGDHLWGIEFRQMNNLERIQLIQNPYTVEPREYLNALSLSPDGRWLLTDSSNDQEEEGLYSYDLKTRKCFFDPWEDLKYDPPYYPDEAFYYKLIQIFVSPDQRSLVLNVGGTDDHALHIISSFLVDRSERKSPLLYEQTSGFHISHLGFDQNFTKIVYFRTSHAKMKNPIKGWIGELVAVSPTQPKQFWRIPIDATFTGSEIPLSEEYYPGGYAGKVLVGSKEVVCTAPKGLLLFFDLQTGEFKRKIKVKGDHIFALDWHPSGKRIRVATDQELQVIDWE